MDCCYLIIEDRPLMIHQLLFFLKLRGAEAVVSYNLAEAENWVSNFEYTGSQILGIVMYGDIFSNEYEGLNSWGRTTPIYVVETKECSVEGSPDHLDLFVGGIGEVLDEISRHQIQISVDDEIES